MVTPRGWQELQWYTGSCAAADTMTTLSAEQQHPMRACRCSLCTYVHVSLQTHAMQDRCAVKCYCVLLLTSSSPLCTQ